MKNRIISLILCLALCVGMLSSLTGCGGGSSADALVIMTEQLDGLLGLLGGACATLGVILPSFIVILTVAKIFEAFKTNKYVKACMYGLKAAVPGLIGVAVLSMAKTVFVPNGFEEFSFSDVSLYISLAI